MLEIDGFTIDKHSQLKYRYTSYNFLLKDEIVRMLSIGQNSYCNGGDNILQGPISV